MQVDPEDIPSKNAMKKNKRSLSHWVDDKKKSGYDSIQHNR
jgi:hypothetical protein